MLEIKGSDLENRERGSNKLTIVIDDPTTSMQSKYDPSRNHNGTTQQKFNSALSNTSKENQMPA